VDRYVVFQQPNDMSANTTLRRIYRNGDSPDQVSYMLSSTPFEYTILMPSQVLRGRGGDRKNLHHEWLPWRETMDSLGSVSSVGLGRRGHMSLVIRRRRRRRRQMIDRRVFL